MWSSHEGGVKKNISYVMQKSFLGTVWDKKFWVASQAISLEEIYSDLTGAYV